MDETVGIHKNNLDSKGLMSSGGGVGGNLVFLRLNGQNAKFYFKAFGTNKCSNHFAEYIYIRANIIMNDEILEQVNQFTYLGCSLSYQCSNDV